MPPDRSTSSTPVGSHPPGQPLHASHSQSNSHSNSHSHSQQQQQQQQQHQKPHGSRTGRGPPPAETSIKLLSKIPNILPHERVFPIQIGSELFQLSGASISSDGEFVALFRCPSPTLLLIPPSRPHDTSPSPSYLNPPLQNKNMSDPIPPRCPSPLVLFPVLSLPAHVRRRQRRRPFDRHPHPLH